MKKIMLVLLVLGIGAFNLSITDRSISTGSTSLYNLQALQSSASEAYCSPTTSNSCTISVPGGGVILTGVGQPVIIFN